MLTEERATELWDNMTIFPYWVSDLDGWLNDMSTTKEEFEELKTIINDAIKRHWNYAGLGALKLTTGDVIAEDHLADMDIYCSNSGKLSITFEVDEHPGINLDRAIEARKEAIAKSTKEN